VHPEFSDVVCGNAWPVALVQIGMPRLFAAPIIPQPPGWRCGAAAWVMMLDLGLADRGVGTTPYAAFHFHRVTPYGVLANLAGRCRWSPRW
jgi:competence protein ComEC